MVQVDDYNAHKLRLGDVVLKGQLLEAAVAIVLAFSRGADEETGRVEAAKLGLGRAIETIAELAGKPGYPLDTDAVKAWVKVAREAKLARDTAIHQPWAAVAENDEHTVGLNARLDPRDSAIVRADPGDLDESIALISRAGTDGFALVGRQWDVSAGNTANASAE
jgi:hypothetical protein